MSIDPNKIIFKRLIREYEFLLEDLEDIKTVAVLGGHYD